MAGLSFYGWSFYLCYIVIGKTCYIFPAIFPFGIATVKLLQSARFFDFILLNY